MKEGNVIDRVMLEISKLKCRLFRNNTGMGWSGELLRKKEGTVTLGNARPLHAGLVKGSSDLIGWTTVTVTPEMVGKEVAVFTAMEVKTGKLSPTKEQANFLQRVNDAGGIAGVAHSPEEAAGILKKYR